MRRLGICLSLVLICYSSRGGDRHALVVGIDRYERLPAEAQLAVAVKDAELMAKTLSELDPAFNVTLLRNAGRQEFGSKLNEFVSEASRSECVLLYFAGHGIEYHGENYLLTKDSRMDLQITDVLSGKGELSSAAVSVDKLLEMLHEAGANLTVVVLDACRDNPFEVASTSVGPDGQEASARKGLGHVTAPSGMVISYAADAGQAANDGLFTGVLTKHMKFPGRRIMEVFAATREEVRKHSESLERDKKGVRHEPAEYCKLDLEGLQFSFLPESVAVEKPESRMTGLKNLFNDAKKKLEDVTEEMKDELPEVKEKLEKAKSGLVEPDTGFTNSLGMRFVSVPGTDVLFCVHETRVKDYMSFARRNREYLPLRKPEIRELNGIPENPIVGITPVQAMAFCEWLSEKEGERYRLPTDGEWSDAVGTDFFLENSLVSKKGNPFQRNYDFERDPYFRDKFPWGSDYPPQSGIENLPGVESSGNVKIEAYQDDHPKVAPVMSYSASDVGLFDMGGNVCEIVTDPIAARGGAWSFHSIPGGNDPRKLFLSTYRHQVHGGVIAPGLGFRIVKEKKERLDTQSGITESQLEGKSPGEKKTFGGITMVWCPPTGPEGFYKGQPLGTANRGLGQQDTVRLESGFWLAETECTQGIWKQYTGQGVVDLWSLAKQRQRYTDEVTGVGEDHPVYFLTGTQVAIFLAELNRRHRLPEGWIWGLPTESQWEYACFADESRNLRRPPYHYGEKLYPHANFAVSDEDRGIFTGPQRRAFSATDEYKFNREKGTMEVKSFEPNSWGLYDMHGNVAEICSWIGTQRKWGNVRGGSFSGSAQECRGDAGGRWSEDYNSDDCGFRIAIVKRDTVFTGSEDAE